MFDIDKASEYKHGFTTKIDSNTLPPGLNADIVKEISKKKNEPQWVLDFRLKALDIFYKLKEPTWSELKINHIDYNAISYYSEPKKYKSWDEVDPEIAKTYEKLGIPIHERNALAGVAVDAVFDSVSVATTFQEELKKHGVIFCPLSEAIQQYGDTVKKYLGSVVPINDNKYACLNSAVFTEGSFVYIPKNVKCPMELSTYFRINEVNTGQFERTLIIAEDNSYVSYLEGCTAPIRKENQLHAAIVELVALNNAEIKYSTVQNWYAGNKDGEGGVYNFVTKRGLCKGKKSKISWIQVEVGASITWKYPSCVLLGDNSHGSFRSIALSNHKQQADTGTKMVHLGKNTKSQIISKGITGGQSVQTYRGLVQINKTATGSRNTTKCDSLILNPQSIANTIPKIKVNNCESIVEHEASAIKLTEEQMVYCMQRGIDEDRAGSIIVSGFCAEIIQALPMEFALEARKLLEVSMEGAVG